MGNFEQLNSYLISLSSHRYVHSLELRSSVRGEDFSFGHSQVPMQETTSARHLITSTSKVFASCLTLLLEREGLLSIEDPISNYLSQDEYRGLVGQANSLEAGSLTLRHLLSHSSGIPSYYSQMALPTGPKYTAASASDPGWEFERALEIARSLPKKPKSTKRADYSFTNFLILSKVLERASGLSLNALLEEKILKPLKLSDSALLDKQHLELFEQISSVYFGKELYLGSRRIASLGLDGAVISTTKDVLAFAQGLSSGKLGDGIFEEMKKDFKNLYPGIDYGLGLMKFHFPARGFGNKQVLFGHLGASGHFLLLDPQRQLFVTGTTNQLGRPFFNFKVVRKIAKLLS